MYTTAELKTMTTVELTDIRAGRQIRMAELQAEGRWDDASRLHETHIAPVNMILLKRGVW